MTPYDSDYWQEQCEHWIAEAKHWRRWAYTYSLLTAVLLLVAGYMFVQGDIQ